MIRVKKFDEYTGWNLEKFLKEQGIQREQIISTSLGVDSMDTQRIVSNGIYKILLVYEDGR